MDEGRFNKWYWTTTRNERGEKEWVKTDSAMKKSLGWQE